MKSYRNPLDIITEGRTLPDGYDSWGIKSVGFDGRTRNGFLWPEPGHATAVHPLDDHDSSCPVREGDGLCVATTWQGMASGGFRAFCLLLVAYRSEEARGDELGRFRTSQVFVSDRLDGEDLVRSSFQGADLGGANLRGAYLWGADLWGAYLRGADLRGACLRGAYLRGADLRGAYLWGADLWGAYLRGADLQGADLQSAERVYAEKAGAIL